SASLHRPCSLACGDVRSLSPLGGRQISLGVRKNRPGTVEAPRARNCWFGSVGERRSDHGGVRTDAPIAGGGAHRSVCHSLRSDKPGIPESVLSGPARALAELGQYQPTNSKDTCESPVSVTSVAALSLMQVVDARRRHRTRHDQLKINQLKINAIGQ